MLVIVDSSNTSILKKSGHFNLPCEKPYVIIRSSKLLQAELAADSYLFNLILEPCYLYMKFFIVVKGHSQHSRFSTVSVVMVRRIVQFHRRIMHGFCVGTLGPFPNSRPWGWKTKIVPLKKHWNSSLLQMSALVMRGLSHNPRTPRVTRRSGWGG